MLVSEVRIENIKGFGAGDRGVSLNFTRPDGSLPRWIVVAGRNGAGKTTFLQALALAITGTDTVLALQLPSTQWINSGSMNGWAMVAIQRSKAGPVMSTKETSEPHWVGVSFVPAGGPDRDYLARAWETPEKVRAACRSNRPSDWFVAGYGPFRRVSGATAEAERLTASTGRAASLASLFHEGASLAEAVVWLQQLYLRRLEGSTDDARLERLVLRLLDDGLLPESMRVVKVTSDGLWVRTPDGLELPLQSLSDGYRTVAALVLDLVRQLNNAFGGLQEIAGSEHVAFAHEGVVLIDEIDVHLHVSWQQRIGFWLKDHFPNLQFIVTTHSPFICQAADPSGLVRLPAPGEDAPARILDGELFNRVVNGTADDAVLTDLFGLETPYSERAVRLREETAELESRAAGESLSEDERQRLNDLRAQLPHTPSSDVADALRDLTRALNDEEA